MSICLWTAVAVLQSPARRAPCARHRAAIARMDATGPAPDEWREFRKNLIAGGIRLTTDEDGGAAAEEAPAPAASERRSVAPKNEQLLQSQNAKLFTEYMEGAWCHPSAVPEAGGLLCRLPLEAQLVGQMRRGDGAAHWGDALRRRLDESLPVADGDGDGDGDADARAALSAQWAANTAYVYRLAEGLVKETIARVASKASNGKVDARDLKTEDLELIEMYQKAASTWQEVCLVLRTSADAPAVATRAVVLNRPLAKGMDENLARLILNGDAPKGAAARYDDAFVQKFVRAFEGEAAVYLGGPREQGAGGTLIHGIEGLPDAMEVAPGTRIFEGGVEAVVDGVLGGTIAPLDVRWFVGRHTELSAADGGWQAVACARTIALKQCLGLPKPLWHEVLELCGGEPAELSRLEIVKRPDVEE